FYANRFGGASATGIGEYIMLTTLSKYAVDLVSRGLTAVTAT
ncbi:MAG TPA: asparaginase, partial [Desulfurococcales archaeon]|nr:asparaginase [Desulfurococcales archaeon]